MSLRLKIMFGYGVTLLLMVVLLIWAVLNLVNLGQASEAILRENYKSILAAENMIDSIERQDSATLLLMLDYKEEGLIQFRENENFFLQWLGRAKDNITISIEKDILGSIESGYSTYLVNFGKLREILLSSPEKAGVFYHETVLPSFKHVRDEAVRLREVNHDAMFAASRKAETVSKTAIWSTILFAGVSILIGLVISLLLSKRLVLPVKHLMKASEALAEGNYDVEVPAEGADELGTLGAGFNAMAKKLGVYNRLNVERIVAEKRKSEAVLHSIEDGVIVVDQQYRIVELNPQAGRMLGIATDSIEGKHFLEVVKDERIFKLIKQAAETKKPPHVENNKNILSIGEENFAKHYLFSITPVISKGGGMFGVVLLLKDVTHLKELDQMKNEFIMTASHELKTPLQSICMSIDLLSEGASEKLNEKQKNLLKAASEETKRLKSLISDLLDLSKIEAGKLELEFDQVPPHILINKAMEIFKPQAEEKNINLTADVPEDIPDVTVDANKITWVVTNLIANAMRYADKKISLSVCYAGQWVHMSVEDDGEGIPPEFQSRIFDKFVQVKSEKSVGGTGLGLAICKEIVRAHKGTIWLDSVPGKGSTFTFTLPVAGDKLQ